MQLLHHGTVHTWLFLNLSSLSWQCVTTSSFGFEQWGQMVHFGGHGRECLMGRHVRASAESSLWHKLVSSVGYSSGGWEANEGGWYY